MNLNGLTAELKRTREELMQCKREIREYKNINSVSNEEQKFLLDQLEYEKELRQETNAENLKLRGDLEEMRQHLKEKNKYRKPWSEIKDHKTKKRRISEYKSVIQSSILKSIPECTRANLSLSLDGQNVNIALNRNELMGSEGNNAAVRSSSEHRYSSNKPESENFGEPDTTSQICRIYDGDGKFLRRHKCRMIYVMDKFRISHQAYHELYMHSKGHLPPIGQIIKEKKRMSELIPYYMHPDVSKEIFL